MQKDSSGPAVVGERQMFGGQLVQLCGSFLLRAPVPEPPNKSLRVCRHRLVPPDRCKASAGGTGCNEGHCALQKSCLLLCFPEPFLSLAQLYLSEAFILQNGFPPPPCFFFVFFPGGFPKLRVKFRERAGSVPVRITAVKAKGSDSFSTRQGNTDGF